jgi:3-methyl-2-oxobutanoate hydroxymethyltransferase
VVLGLDTTRTIPAEFLLTLTAAVRRGAPNSFVMADLPFGWRRGSVQQVTDWTRRFFQETGSDAVKIEVTGEDAGLVESVRDAGVPVVAHLGLLPQNVDPAEGYRARGRDAAEALRIIEDAHRLEAAGAAVLLVEAVPGKVAREIASHTALPVIGCVAGPHCDGTVVVLHDMIGWGGGHKPRGVKQYADLTRVLGEAFASYAADVQAGEFPRESDAIRMKPGEYEKLMSLAGGG